MDQTLPLQLLYTKIKQGAKTYVGQKRSCTDLQENLKLAENMKQNAEGLETAGRPRC